MAGAALYECAQPGRNFASLLFLAVSLPFAGLGLAYGAPLVWFLPVGFVVLGADWLVFRNPLSGCHLTSERIRFFSGRWRREIPLADIRQIRVTRWGEGAPSYFIDLGDGKTEMISSGCVADVGAFIQALRSAGLTVDDPEKS